MKAMVRGATTLRWEVHDDVPADAAGVVDDGIGRFNDAAAPLHEVRKLASFARDASGRVVGGAVGRTWGECCELQQLWVEEPHRRRGVGRQLLTLFHARSEERGCHTFYLETFNFQAPEFYRRMGYEVMARIDGFGHGIVKYTMQRKL